MVHEVVAYYFSVNQLINYWPNKFSLAEQWCRAALTTNRYIKKKKKDKKLLEVSIVTLWYGICLHLQAKHGHCISADNYQFNPFEGEIILFLAVKTMLNRKMFQHHVSVFTFTLNYHFSDITTTTVVIVTKWRHALVCFLLSTVTCCCKFPAQRHELDLNRN